MLISTLEFLKIFFDRDSFYNGEKSLLEIGCGIGSFLNYMKLANWRVEGLEPDSAYAEKSKERYNIDLKNQLLEDFKTDNKYDAISTFHVIEHVDDPNDFLSKINFLLKEDGLLFLECPTIDRMYGWRTSFFFWDVHINSFSNKTLEAFLVKHGFKVEQIKIRSSFINIIARKSSSPKNHELFYDSPKRIESIISNRKKQLIKARVKRKLAPYYGELKSLFVNKKEAKSNLRIIHGGFHNSINTGDIALFDAVREQYKYYLGNIDFTLLNIHLVVNDKIIKLINSHDALILGGGGLFLKDTNENNISGWQWSCSLEMMKKIKVPIFIHAVGYNRFRGQDDFIDKFGPNVNQLFEQASFIGLRNYGSIYNIKDYVQKDLHKKIVFQPCSTTLMSDYYEYGVKVEESKVVAFNFAFDRHFMRFGNTDSKIRILDEIVLMIKRLQKHRIQCVLVNHVLGDEQFNIHLRKLNINLKEIDLIGKPVEEIICTYKKFSLVVGMRGHAQMIPFGLKVPIISLISHNKMQYFLNDIELSEQGVEITNNNLNEELYKKIIKTIENGNQKFVEAQRKLREVTDYNFEQIKKILN